MSWQARLEQWLTRLEQTQGAALEEVSREVASSDLATLTSAADAIAWLQAALVCVLNRREVARLVVAALSVQGRFTTSAPVAALTADLGFETWRSGTIPPGARPPLAEIERLYRLALELAPEDAAGPALGLAQVYRATDRARDALDVLDLAIKTGCREGAVAFEAGSLALGLGLAERAVTCFDLCIALAPGVSGEPLGRLYYLRTQALLELAKHEEAVASIDKAVTGIAQLSLVADAVRALAAAERDDAAVVARHVVSALDIPLSTLNELPATVLSAAFGFARRAAAKIDHPQLLGRLDARRRRAALITDEELDETREASDEAVAKGLSVWSVTLDQPLPADRRASPDCPRWERDWPAYRVTWHVLAPDEADARGRALAAQRRCGEPAPASVHKTARAEGPLIDGKPGVVAHSAREPLAPPK